MQTSGHGCGQFALTPIGYFGSCLEYANSRHVLFKKKKLKKQQLITIYSSSSAFAKRNAMTDWLKPNNCLYSSQYTKYLTVQQAKLPYINAALILNKYSHQHRLYIQQDEH